MARSLKRGRTRRIGSLIGRVGRGAFARRGFRNASVLTDWEAVVGPGYAARCTPESLRPDGTLVLRTDGATAVLLQHVEPQLRERVAVCYGYDVVKRIVYRQEPLPPPVAAVSPPRPAPEPPGKSAAALAAVPDSALREALVRLGREVAGANRALVSPPP